MWVSMGMEAQRPIRLLPTGLSFQSSLRSFKAGGGWPFSPLPLQSHYQPCPPLNTFQKCLYGWIEYTVGLFFSVSIFHSYEKPNHQQLQRETKMNVRVLLKAFQYLWQLINCIGANLLHGADGGWASVCILGSVC